jgi:hypothetical protein
MVNQELEKLMAIRGRRAEFEELTLAERRAAAADQVMSENLPPNLERSYMIHIYGKRLIDLAQQGQE